MDATRKSQYMSGVGSAIYLSMDIEFLAFGVKELARALHAPTEGDMADFKRLARFLQQTGDWTFLNELERRPAPDEVLKAQIWHDSDHAGSW